jgi:glycosyltransferase involved in cell wall biosynthesis
MGHPLLLTILMSVKNGEPYILESIGSILNQTYGKFKFLIIDNSSGDRTREMIRSVNDSRIRLIELDRDRGQAAALNMGMDLADTPFIGRMDADDICMPERFEKQIACMRENPDVGICGTWAVSFGAGREERLFHPVSPEEINVMLMFESALVHSSVVMRKSELDKFNLRYDENLGHSEDWDLWQRASRDMKIVNLPEPLLRYRVHDRSVSRRNLDRVKKTAEILDERALQPLGLHHHELRHVHRDISMITFHAGNRGAEFIREIVSWKNLLLAANRKSMIFDQAALDAFLKKRLFLVLNYNTGLFFESLAVCFREALFFQAGFVDSLKLLAKLILTKLRLYRQARCR